jgi:Uma2 family endonuclease
MATVQERPAPSWSIAKLQEYFGGIPAERILLKPRPGTATEKDLIRENDRGVRPTCELIDGCLVEKAMGARESLLQGIIVQWLNNFVLKRGLGVILESQGTLRFLPGLVRVPDACFISWERIGADEFPDKPIPDLIPELVVEVLSVSNTKKEMARKLEDYFSNGVLEAWLIDPRKRKAEIYSSPDNKRTIGEDGVLECPTILPGFQLALPDLFAAQKRRRS